MKKICRPVTLLATLGLLFTATIASADDSSSNLTRQILLKKPVSLSAKDIEANVIHVYFPKGYKTPLHTHEGPGPRYVLKGKLKIEDAGQSKLFSAGEVFWESGEEMTVENVGKGEAEIIIFEMAPVKPAAH